jgi:predicted alpha/beta superfamily hydrolase
MKSIFFTISLVITLLHVQAQENSPFTTGFEEKINSKILGEERNVWIHIPRSNGGNKIKDKGNYPVVYLLDGAENFNSVVAITEHMSETSLCPPMIVVGIVQSDRLSELTTGTENEFPGILGKGEKFMSYITTELIPHIDTSYPTTSYKTIIGHSVGGLTVVNALIHQPGIFNSYISLDGALWWNDHKVIKDAIPVLKSQNFKGKKLYMAMANRLERGVDTLSVQKDTSGSTDLLRSNLELIKLLNKNKANQLQYKYKFYENDNHPSITLAGEYDALRYIFEFYQLKVYDSELANPAFKLDSLLIAHSKIVSEQMGYLVQPDESQVNNLGYQMIGKKQYNKAENLFKLNIANHPGSGNCYDSLGDLYLAKGDKVKAIETFKKALTLSDIPETKQKLQKLQAEGKK